MRLIHTARFEKDYSATPTDVHLLSAAIAPVGASCNSATSASMVRSSRHEACLFSIFQQTSVTGFVAIILAPQLRAALHAGVERRSRNRVRRVPLPRAALRLTQVRWCQSLGDGIARRYDSLTLRAG